MWTRVDESSFDTFLTCASGLSILVVSVLLVKSCVWPRSSLPYPPGPRPLPFLGNVFDWPWESGWLKFAEWSKLYGKCLRVLSRLASLELIRLLTGDMIHVKILGQHVIVLNSVDTAKDLMNQGIYSDRPKLTMIGELYVLPTHWLPQNLYALS
jgi:hypothetical protein